MIVAFSPMHMTIPLHVLYHNMNNHNRTTQYHSP